MSANQGRFHVATMARVLGVSPSGYYAWRQRPPSARAQADAELTDRVQEIHARSRGTYGAPRIHAELAEDGVAVGRKRVARLMRTAGIAGVSRRRGPRTTRRDVQARPGAGPRRAPLRGRRSEPLVGGRHNLHSDPGGGLHLHSDPGGGLPLPGHRPGCFQPAHHRLGDGGAPAHRTGDRSVGDGHRATPARSGRASQRPGLPVQASLAFGARCRESGVALSMGSVGDCFDNAMAESFFATLECELLDRTTLSTHAEARAAVFQFVEGWYNTLRRHSALGYVSPLEFERRHAAAAVDVERPGEALPTPASEFEPGLPPPIPVVTGLLLQAPGGE